MEAVRAVATIKTTVKGIRSISKKIAESHKID